MMSRNVRPRKKEIRSLTDSFEGFFPFEQKDHYRSSIVYFMSFSESQQVFDLMKEESWFSFCHFIYCFSRNYKMFHCLNYLRSQLPGRTFEIQISRFRFANFVLFVLELFTIGIVWKRSSCIIASNSWSRLLVL